MVRQFVGHDVRLYPSGNLIAGSVTLVGSVYASTGTETQVATFLQGKENVIDYQIASAGTAGSYTAFIRTL